MGRSEDPYLLAGESGYDEREVLPAARREGDEVALSATATYEARPVLLVAATTRARSASIDEAMEHIGGMAGTAVTQLIYMTSADEQDPRRAEGPLDPAGGAQSPGAAPQVGRRTHRPTTLPRTR